MRAEKYFCRVCVAAARTHVRSVEWQTHTDRESETVEGVGAASRAQQSKANREGNGKGRKHNRQTHAHAHTHRHAKCATRQHHIDAAHFMKMKKRDGECSLKSVCTASARMRLCGSLVAGLDARDAFRKTKRGRVGALGGDNLTHAHRHIQRITRIDFGFYVDPQMLRL